MISAVNVIGFQISGNTQNLQNGIDIDMKYIPPSGSMPGFFSHFVAQKLEIIINMYMNILHVS